MCVQDLLGKSFDMLASKEGQLASLVADAGNYTAAELDAGAVQVLFSFATQHTVALFCLLARP